MPSLEVPAIKVNQWMQSWNDVKFNEDDNIRKPLPYYFLFTIKAGTLKKLSKVYPRRADDKRDVEVGIQRKHDPERSEGIKKYIHYGYPLADIVRGNTFPIGTDDLKMPGWLPTAIVANILSKDTKRGEHTINNQDLIQIEDGGLFAKIVLPERVNDPKWNPVVPPIEIIDGQHRLWAFDIDDAIANDFELPVVAFYDLDISWQAYLFYTINVKPKKINRSLAYDLYPLLRVQEWLERSPETALVYKETRAQEMVEVLWAYPKSPWNNRINMLGETKSNTNITQAAFIRNLIASFIKTSTTRGLGGLFGSKLNDTVRTPLSWNRTQQAAFLIYSWQRMYEEIRNCQLSWAESLRSHSKEPNVKLFNDDKKADLAFFSPYSLISTDQGVRGFLHIINDFSFILSKELELRYVNWTNKDDIKEDRIDLSDLERCIKDLDKSIIKGFIKELCKELIQFDWRTSSEPNLNDLQRRNQMVFKGSSGYKELRNQLLTLLANSKNELISKSAITIRRELGYGA